MLAADFWAQWSDLADVVYQVCKGTWVVVEGKWAESHDYNQYGLNWRRLLAHEGWTIHRHGNAIQIFDETGKAVPIDEFRDP